MELSSRARIAGIVGMAGAFVSIAFLILARSLGLEYGAGQWSVAGELVAFSTMIAVNIGFLGLIWGGAFRGRFGRLAVLTHVAAYALIVLGGILTLVLNSSESMHFVLFPIGGALEGIAAMLLIVAVLADARWQGWQRWVPLCYGVYELLAVGLPIVMGVTPDGPGLSVQIGTNVWWFLVGLAVYTAQAAPVARPPRTAASEL